MYILNLLLKNKRLKIENVENGTQSTKAIDGQFFLHKDQFLSKTSKPLLAASFSFIMKSKKKYHNGKNETGTIFSILNPKPEHFFLLYFVVLNK